MRMHFRARHLFRGRTMHAKCANDISKCANDTSCVRTTPRRARRGGDSWTAARHFWHGAGLRRPPVHVSWRSSSSSTSARTQMLPAGLAEPAAIQPGAPQWRFRDALSRGASELLERDRYVARDSPTPRAPASRSTIHGALTSRCTRERAGRRARRTTHGRRVVAAGALAAASLASCYCRSAALLCRRRRWRRRRRRRHPRRVHRRRAGCAAALASPPHVPCRHAPLAPLPYCRRHGGSRLCCHCWAPLRCRSQLPPPLRRRRTPAPSSPPEPPSAAGAAVGAPASPPCMGGAGGPAPRRCAAGAKFCGSDARFSRI